MKLLPTTMKMKRLGWGLALLPLLSSCDALMGKEVARLPINAVSTAGHEVVREATVQLQKDDKIALWSDMDLAYEGGSAPVRFQVQVMKNGTPFQQLQIDPTEKNITVGEVKPDINGSVSWRFSGKNAELVAPDAGSYTFRAMLVAAANPTLRVTKAELVLKK